METIVAPNTDPKAWISLREALLNPKRFFPTLDPLGSYGPALLFAIALSFLSSIGFAIEDLLFPQNGGSWLETWPWYWNLLDWPILLAFEFAFLAWFHAVLRWRGGTLHPFKATFRAYCYSAAPNVFAMIPLVGVWIAMIWGTVLACYAVKTLQKTSWTRVITSFLIANALLGLFLFMLIFIAGYFRHYFE